MGIKLKWRPTLIGSKVREIKHIAFKKKNINDEGSINQAMYEYITKDIRTHKACSDLAFFLLAFLMGLLIRHWVKFYVHSFNIDINLQQDNTPNLH